MHLPGQMFADFSFPGNLLERLAMPVTVLLVLALAHTLASLTWSLWPEPTSPSPPPHSSVARPAATVREPDTEAIIQNNIFGKADTAPSSSVATIISAPETSLKLTLRGIIAAAPPDGGAIIAEPGKSDRFFRVGDSITGGTVLQEVKPDQVIMMRNHRLETLSLPKESKLRGLNRPSDPPALTNSAPDAEPDPDDEDIEVDDESDEEQEEEEDPGQTLNHFRDQLFENPASLMTLVKTQPVYQSGRLQGFRLSPGPKGGDLLKRYGLKSNDLVTSLNGISLDNPMKAFEVLRNLRNAPTLKVGVSREGRTENITLHFNR